jgi:hypothetical protein
MTSPTSAIMPEDGDEERRMGKVFEQIDERLQRWIEAQRLFFVGTAPSGDDGHVNVSPKGPIDSLRVVGPLEVAYLDLVGSGAETIAHLRENGRIVVMLCAFEGPPRIVRLHGRGSVVSSEDAGYAAAVRQLGLDAIPGWDDGGRSLIRVEVARVADSCGYGVPLMAYEGERPQRLDWLDRKLRQGGRGAIRDYVATHNAASIDGLPALDPAAV